MRVVLADHRNCQIVELRLEFVIGERIVRVALAGVAELREPGPVVGLDRDTSAAAGGEIPIELRLCFHRYAFQEARDCWVF